MSIDPTGQLSRRWRLIFFVSGVAGIALICAAYLRNWSEPWMVLSMAIYFLGALLIRRAAGQSAPFDPARLSSSIRWEVFRDFLRFLGCGMSGLVVAIIGAFWNPQSTIGILAIAVPISGFVILGSYYAIRMSQKLFFH